MTVQFSDTVHNARLSAIETAIGASAVVRIYTGALPPTCADATTGTLLVSYTLAADWLGVPAAGSVTYNNLPIAGVGAATGTVGYYRVFDSTVTTCHEQGTVTETGGGGDMTIDNVNIAIGVAVNIVTWTKTDG